ncbi:Quinohemoprotein amine dehydrogenase (fragment) [Candidatus Sulfopaludibacter sp. SbA6]
MAVKNTFLVLVVIAVSVASPALAQTGGGGRGGRGAPAVPTEEGIPVTEALVISKCGTCHAKDDKGNLSRISWERTTPEGWEEAIKRMVRLNGVQLTPAEARPILKYLATYHGLAPEEAKPVMYMAEHRILDEAVPNETVRTTCMNCHALGRAFSWRRSKEDWRLLTNMHSAFFPQAEAAFRSGGGFGGGGGGGPNAGRGGRGGGAAAGTPGAPGAGATSLDETLNFLEATYPLHTPEWSAWRARMRAPRIAGRWLVSAYIPGRGKYFGEMAIDPGAAEDEFTTRVKLQSVNGGPALTTAGPAWSTPDIRGAGAPRHPACRPLPTTLPRRCAKSCGSRPTS